MKKKCSCVWSVLVLLGIGVALSQTMWAEEYILDARPKGDFGDELSTYWNRVNATRGKKVDVTNKAVDQYPPHVSLTGFFPKDLAREEYIRALQEAVQEQKGKSRKVNVQKIVQGNSLTKAKDFDYIKLSSNFFESVTKSFMKKAHIDDQYFKDPSDFTYHITLRQYFNKPITKTMLKTVHNLQDDIDLSAHDKWSLFLYSKNGFPPLTQVVLEIPL